MAEPQLDDFADVLVVGAGPAGMSAAVAASDAGATVRIIEREGHPGGVLRQCIHDGFGLGEYGERLTGPEYAHRQISGVTRRGIPVDAGAHIHTMTPTGDGWQVDLITPAGVSSIRAAAVVMATGCRERTDRQIYLHGDRPAGIFTAGQAQRLINIDGVMPGRDVVVLGSGDIGLIMARRFVLEGARVRGVYEKEPSASGLARNVAQCLEDWSIPLHLSATVTEVHGRDRVESVTVCPVDNSGVADRSKPATVACDTLILSVGLIPENDIIVDLGGELDPRTGGPEVTQRRECGLPGLFVCGNALHVYDLVDHVSECGAAAGSAAAEHAEQHKVGRRACPSPQLRPDGATTIPVVASGMVSQIVPQRLHPGGPPPVFFLRVNHVAESASLVVRSAGAELCRRRLNYLRPPEMIRYELPEAVWAQIGGGAVSVGITVEATDAD